MPVTAELIWEAWTRPEHVTIEPEGDGTRYTARAIHGNEDDRSRHEAMGFHDGWSRCLDQLVELAGTL